MLPSSSKYILLVEDNLDDIDLTLMALEKNNIANEVVVARNGVEALDLLHPKSDEKLRSLPAVVLLDINMPKMSGLEALKIIRNHKRTKSLPVVILTSSKEDQDILESYENGANSYIRKPVDFVNFTEAVKQLGMYWLLLNEPLPK
jgi:CheY-like chemotaxis protein